MRVRTKRYDTLVVHEDGTIIGAYGRPIRGGLASIGYRQVKCRGRCLYVHRLVAEAFLPNPEGRVNVNHKDGNKLNNHVLNLEWATPAENNSHAYATGLQPSGEDNPRSKLTNEDATNIRESYKNKYRGWRRDTATRYGVSERVIYQIIKGITYKTC